MFLIQRETIAFISSRGQGQVIWRREDGNKPLFFSFFSIIINIISVFVEQDYCDLQVSISFA
jgi:hypothetical protein